MDNREKTDDITLLREEIVKKINNIANGHTPENASEELDHKTTINRLRHKMSSLSEENESN